jgi:hypothetical protein
VRLLKKQLALKAYHHQNNSQEMNDSFKRIPHHPGGIKKK